MLSAPPTLSKKQLSTFSLRRSWLPRELNDPLAGFSIRWRLNWMKQMLRGPRMTLGALLLVSGVMMLGGAALSACAPRIIATEINVPSELRGRCARPDLPPKKPEAGPSELLRDTQDFSLKQEGAMNVCEAKSMAKDTIIDAHNAAVRRANCPFWKVWGCK